MKDFGFLRTAAARPRVKPADVAGNVRSICELIDRAAADEVSLLVFPELCVTGYTCGDLFGQEFLLEAAEKGIREIISRSRGKDITIVAGTPVAFRGRLYNCAAVIRNGCNPQFLRDSGSVRRKRMIPGGRGCLWNLLKQRAGPVKFYI